MTSISPLATFIKNQLPEAKISAQAQFIIKPNLCVVFQLKNLRFIRLLSTIQFNQPVLAQITH